MFGLNRHKSSDILSCISYCGKIDRLIHKYKAPFSLPENILKLNAGYSDGMEPGSRDDMIAKGTIEWLKEFHKDPNSFSLSNTSLKSMHRKLFKYSKRDDGTRGRYRSDLDKEMKVLFDETRNALASYERHPLFMISYFRISFINAMPFITGNSLCANLIAYALLYHNSYGVVSQVPLIASLNNADSSLSKDVLSLLPKTLFELLLKRPQATHTTDPRPQAPKTYLNTRRKRLLKHIQKNAPLKISDIMTSFPEESRNTIKKDLLYLREKEMIIAHGEGRGMYYIVTRDS